MVEHHGVVNMLTDINRRFDIGPRDRAFGISSLSFDASVYDVFGILAAGGAVVLPDPADRPDPSQWVELLDKEHVTFWNSVPSLMEMLVEHLGARTDAPLGGLRLTVLSGDWIPLDLPRRLRALAPRIQVMSSGGPTETIVWSVMFEVGDVDENGTGTVSWNLVEATVLKAMDGSYRLRENGSGTEVTYTLAVDLRVPMLGMLRRKAEKVIIDTALNELKKRVEG